MAFGVKVRGIPRDDAMPVWQVEAYWWNARELREDPRFRLIESPGYQDYVAILTVKEAQTLHKYYIEEGPDELPEHWLDHFNRLEEGLAQDVIETRWVMVEVFEW